MSKLIASQSTKSKKVVDIEKLKNSVEFINLSNFFEQKNNFDLTETILKKKKKISLRVVEYVTANSRKFFFNIYDHGVFRDKLDALGKRNFDVFRRSSRFEVSLGGRTITTNLSQMRFFRHAISAGVIDWLLESEENVKRAEKSMNEELSKKIKKPRGSRKKRKRELRAIGTSNITFSF